jgi:hypothetical protein
MARLIARIAVLIVAGLLLELRGVAQTMLPGKLAGTAAIVTLTTSEIEELEAGRPVTRLLASGSGDEVMFGAVWIETPVSNYLLAIRDIERFECGGGFAMTKRLSDPPRLEDFADMALPDVDLRDLRSCRAGNCGVKLTDASMNMFQRDIDRSSPTATDAERELVRRMALSLVVAYTARGNAALGPYLDDTRSAVPGRAVAEIIERMPLMSHSEFDLRRFLIEYPNAQLPNSTSFFYWQLVQFGLKPTFRINHVVTAGVPDHFVVASKQVYASHYFRAAVEIRHLIPDPGRGHGFWLIDVSAARVDGLTGVLGALIRGHVQSEALRSLTGGLEATKLKMEAPAMKSCSSGAQ